MPAKSEIGTGFWITVGVIGALLIIGAIGKVLGKL
jgi:hypothetical protein